MEHAPSAMAGIARYASRPFDKFVLIMEPNGRQFETEKVHPRAQCTIDYFVFKRVKNNRWLKQCIKIDKI